jgi:hypothetical protein
MVDRRSMECGSRLGLGSVEFNTTFVSVRWLRIGPCFVEVCVISGSYYSPRNSVLYHPVLSHQPHLRQSPTFPTSSNSFWKSICSGKSIIFVVVEDTYPPPG